MLGLGGHAERRALVGQEPLAVVGRLDAGACLGEPGQPAVRVGRSGRIVVGRVEVAAGSGAERWFDGGPARVNSFHHQCVSEPGARLRATVRAADGVIETLERADGRGFAAGTQWHNELMWRGDERFLRPFEDLVAAARVFRGSA